jgi:adenylate cyclase
MPLPSREVAGREEVEQTMGLARDEVERDIARYRAAMFAAVTATTIGVHLFLRPDEPSWMPTTFFAVATAYAVSMVFVVRRFGARPVVVFGSLLLDFLAASGNFFLIVRLQTAGDHRTFAANIAGPAVLLVIVLNSLRFSRGASLAAAILAPLLYEAVVLSIVGFHPAQVPVAAILVLSALVSAGAASLARRNLDRFARLQLLRRYLPPAAVERVMREDPDVATAVGGKLLTVTLLAADLRGFTAMSEKLTPSEVLAQLNAYHAVMIDIIERHRGVIDKFIGDGTLVVFGLEGSPQAGARDAVKCAAAMLDALAVHNVERGGRCLGELKMGVGVHTGSVIAGNIGVPGRRLEFTVIGDAVNTTARLEGETKQSGTPVLVSEQTAELVGRDGLRELAPVSIRGKDQPVRIYALERLAI